MQVDTNFEIQNLRLSLKKKYILRLYYSVSPGSIAVYQPINVECIKEGKSHTM